MAAFPSGVKDAGRNLSSFSSVIPAMDKTRVLVVDDEESIVDFIRMALQYEGFEVCVARDGQGALEQFRVQQPQLVVLDWMLPGKDGLEVCREIRGFSSTPILMLTARGELEDKVLGLDSGADDYLPKPFKIQELLARVRALLRRTGAEPGKVLNFADVTLNSTTRRVSRGSETLELTGREYDLLEILLRHPHQVLTKEQLLNQVWGWEFEGNTNVVEVHMSALRNKLGDSDRKLIRTVRGVGYALGG
jgi:two-component system, OmpR family, response regulator MprA